jgi:hypothetical protein
MTARTVNPRMNSFSILVCLISLVCAVSVNGCTQEKQSPAQYAVEIEGAEVIRSGIYKIEFTKEGVVRNMELVERTTQIPAHMGTAFGFEYVIKGFPEDANIEVTHKFLHPQMTNPQTKQSFTSQVTITTEKIGEITFIGYIFLYEWEAVPGEWTLQVFYQGKKLAEQSFLIIR